MVAYLTLKIPRIFNTSVYDSRWRDSDSNVVIYNGVWGEALPVRSSREININDIQWKCCSCEFLGRFYPTYFIVIKKRVLVVDDKPGVIRFVQINPAPVGYEAIVLWTENRLFRRSDPGNRILYFLIFLWRRRLALLSPGGGTLIPGCLPSASFYPQRAPPIRSDRWYLPSQ